MRFLKYCFALLLSCILLADKVTKTKSGDVFTEFALGSLPNLASMAGVTFTGPLAPIMVGSLLTLSLATTILKNEASPSEVLSKQDFYETQAKLSESIESLSKQVSEIAAHLIDVTESHSLFEDMRNDLDSLREAVANNYKTIMNRKLTGATKTASMNAMLDYFSNFRETLRSFITKYIKPKGVVVAAGDVNLFYDFVLRRDRNAAEAGDDCHTESVHTKIFKSFMTILKTVTDAYVMAISAHTVQYQKELKENSENAYETQRLAINLLNQYKSDMQVLMEKTHWALDKASRDVRNCGTFDNFERGVSFRRLSFAHILPKFKHYDLVNETSYPIYYLPKYQCYVKEEHVKYSFMEISKSCTDGDLRTPASLTVYINPNNPKWPYVYIKNEPQIAANKVLGNETAFALPDLVTRKYFQTQGCYTMFCDAFKKKVVGVSTGPVKVEEGNVITGVRLAIRDNVIFVEIREGKLLDDLTVDPESLVWAMPEQDTFILYLDSNIRKFELGDIETKNNTYLTSIQIVLKNKAEGILGLSVNGEISEPNPSAPASVAIDLSKSVSPEAFGGNAKNRISEAPQPSKPYHVALQPSDLEKDLGRTTIPFFDTREVAPLPASPITGVGFYHQTVKGSGGFISLKIKQSNLGRFIDYDLVKKTIDSSFNMQ